MRDLEMRRDWLRDHHMQDRGVKSGSAIEVGGHRSSGMIYAVIAALFAIGILVGALTK